ncbi:putative dehydrogenase [Thermosporothrix hazakensis]|jgi:predicted dehydrogenase|uniref:Putative dehydrogenase n=1 Tax=Thermosporothrix hazakensis TaxID=644383 RepID=A0A326U2A9_THEHA|nr:Gfo/Idh/MocA family oxidoreductase [Thermosporothrix hazakensis]PZW24837.1 putative dehydrogenase [Thermosporothrix hazakensis]GCE46473.1 dehydrogenase [Thermosporothrix hazakensis]
MEKKPLHIAIVGCGNIAGAYARTFAPYPQIRLLGATDIDFARAEAYAAEHGGKAYPSLEALLEDPEVDVVVNLSIHHAHAAVIRQCLEAGKDVYSEKPLALSSEEAWALVRLAEEKGRRLSCAPMTILGEAQQTLWKAIRDGLAGEVRVAYAEVNWGRIESWHPAPGPFYEVGALFDAGVYPLTIMTTIFGPARRVIGFGKVLYPDRVTQTGEPFHIETPDFVTATIEFASGAVARLTASFYVGQHSKQKGIEFHGDKGSLFIDSWQEFDAKVEYARFGEAYQPLPYLREPYRGIEWARGVLDIASAIEEQRPQRITGTQAAHVVDILCAIRQSYEQGTPVELQSEFVQPEPMDWAR